MTPYLVSARKYRPTTFESVVGQSALTSTLKNAVVSGRIASSYLFCGTRGVGKTTCARIFAKTINCEHLTAEGNPCNECDSCKAFNAGTSLNIIELDAASNNGVDAMRALTEQVRVPPVQGRYKVFIVDEVHMLSTQAFNAFLKTLEEPPGYVVFVLATTEKQKIIPTILSRCQIYDFHRISIPDIIRQLQYVASQEGVEAEEAALNVIATKADGGMRDALSVFDQVAASSQCKVTYEHTIASLNVLDYKYYTRLTEAFLAGDVLMTWVIYREIRDAGFDSLFFINGLGAYLRDLMMARDQSTVGLVEAGEEARRQMADIGARCTPGFLYRAMSLCNDADLNYRTATNKQFLVELTLAKICQSLSPSPNKGSDGEGRLRKIDAADTKAPLVSAAAATAPTKPSAPAATHKATSPQATGATPQAAPQAPAAPQPHVQASRPATHMPAPGMRSTLKMPVFNINRPNETAAATDDATEGNAAGSGRCKPYSQTDLDNAWDEFIDAFPRKRILVNSMRTSRPVRLDESQVGVDLDSEIQLSTFREELGELLQWMRDRLQNDHLTLQLKVTDREPMRHVLNDRELMLTIIKERPMLEKFIKGLKLTL
ncbi:DNA polymerase III subunit gamma/tau [Paramuribaculum intestinale]|uniref:DNA polymerase III subunit gamma/tau n=1 Tax=Paramuribaculum intestinale TaxID=2094151 RepID=UPI00272EFE5F|nr:DNA polymerase III subunit gamma/tau [Paramuribaculum intestinale]